MQKQITIYSKPNCMQCEMTKKVLKDNNISFSEVDAYESEELTAYIQNLGFTSLPVVEIEGEEPFSGFQPDRLEKIF